MSDDAKKPNGEPRGPCGIPGAFHVLTINLMPSGDLVMTGHDSASFMTVHGMLGGAAEIYAAYRAQLREAAMRAQKQKQDSPIIIPSMVPPKDVKP